MRVDFSGGQAGIPGPLASAQMLALRNRAAYIGGFGQHLHCHAYRTESPKVLADSPALSDHFLVLHPALLFSGRNIHKAPEGVRNAVPARRRRR